MSEAGAFLGLYPRPWKLQRSPCDAGWGLLRFPPFPVTSLGSAPASLEQVVRIAQLFGAGHCTNASLRSRGMSPLFRFTARLTCSPTVATRRSYEEARGFHYNPRPRRLTH